MILLSFLRLLKHFASDDQLKLTLTQVKLVRGEAILPYSWTNKCKMIREITQHVLEKGLKYQGAKHHNQVCKVTKGSAWVFSICFMTAD